ncbi:efflux RND transporter periplasmic adaptor subunit [Ferribacterium limneticum]|uniref:efflux RND transporter periplasmic adaptor subunit n=1 Tax=Ferribacterium limneticum TaxID=76259 RepID=UPI001CFA4A28|nr:efflux RND transporter periplasmic adaptor subunit [Ferribacterium limneticum]UCV28996.1 efflux RND transporter periplasmic adaptor subunit [Ferribacterium limneticum]UCV32914.1 efflux RND transporter periplasmic adaptor subunit [Ferribacterium limneticum]
MKMNWSGALAGRKTRIALVLAVLVVGAAFLMRAEAPKPSESAKAPAASRPALTVRLTAPKTENWPLVLPANGNVVAWQEAVIGAEIANYRITEVRVQVGDVVKKGQVLARISSDTVASELAEAKASVAELEASATEAKGNAERAKELKEKGFYSSQLNTQYQTAEHTAQARLAAARARLQAAGLRMDKTGVLAPDDGVISALSATVGSLTQAGQELFRLIRGGRLEWRAEVQSSELGKVKAGVVARLTAPSGESVKGTVRAVAPSVDPQTRNGLVYVDLPVSSAIRAGMFARGEFELAQSPALALPQSAVVLREGFAYVFRLEGEDRVAQTKVLLGRRSGDRLEVVSGLAAEARVVESGAGFLADGDAVKIVTGNTQ